MIAGPQDHIGPNETVIADFNESSAISVNHNIGVKRSIISNDYFVTAVSGGIKLRVEAEADVVPQNNIPTTSESASNGDMNPLAASFEAVVVIIVA